MLFSKLKLIYSLLFSGYGYCNMFKNICQKNQRIIIYTEISQLFMPIVILQYRCYIVSVVMILL